MSEVMGVGIIGCGNISRAYLRLSKMFKGIEMRACADLNMDAARAQADAYGVRALSVDDILAAEDIDIIVNLTIPATHFGVSRRILEAGKHVFSEKPFVLSGELGQITGGMAAVMGRGMEMWHPNPDFFFKPGGGPVLDIGPYYVTNLVQLIGPVTRVACFASTPRKQREITSQPRAGEFVTVETPTSMRGILEFANGATVTLNTSWDVHAHGMSPMELYGEKGSIFVPDPNFFGGEVRATEGAEPRELTRTWHNT